MNPFFICCWAAVLLMFGIATPAAAQRGGTDEGGYRILKASYGTAERNVDVTERLKELARSDVTFRMGNDTFGVDPHPHRVKTLRIYTRGADGRHRMFEYTEGSIVDGARFTAWGSGNWGRGGWSGGWGETNTAGAGALVIVSASYGAGNRQRDITERVRARVQNDRLDIVADNDLAGFDPAPSTPKTLWVTYTLGGGREQRTRVAESERLSLP